MDKAKEIYSKIIRDQHDRLILVADFDKMQKIINDLQQRIDKAVESIEDCKKVNGDKETCIIDHNYLLNILKGDDTNE